MTFVPRAIGAMKRLRPTVVVAAALALPHAGCSQAPPADPDVVRPRFGWTDGMTARVVTEEEAFEREPAEGDTVRQRTVSTLRVTTHPEGLRIAWMDSGAAAAEAAEGPSALAGVVVSERGTFVRAEGAFEASAALRRGALDAMRDAPPELVRAVEESLSEEAVRAGAHAQWSLLVGRYAGREIAVGEIHEERGTLPRLGGPVRTILEWAAEGRVPCVDGEAEPRCVRFRVRTAADAGDMARSYRALRSAAAGGPEPEIDALDFIVIHVSTEYVVAEEATLRPHRIEAETVLAIESGGEAATSVERRHTRFTYAP